MGSLYIFHRDAQSAQISQKQDEHNICVIMKTMCPPGYHQNGFVATHALGQVKPRHVKQITKNNFLTK